MEAISGSADRPGAGYHGYSTHLNEDSCPETNHSQLQPENRRLTSVKFDASTRNGSGTTRFPLLTTCSGDARHLVGTIGAGDAELFVRDIQRLRNDPVTAIEACPSFALPALPRDTAKDPMPAATYAMDFNISGLPTIQKYYRKVGKVC